MYVFLYCGSFGGFRVEGDALAEYNKRALATGKEAKTNLQIERDDPILIEIFEQMGEKMNNKYCVFKMAQVPFHLKSYVRISEYDGRETVRVDWNHYQRDKVLSILEDANMDDHDKCKQSKQVLKEEPVKITYVRQPLTTKHVS